MNSQHHEFRESDGRFMLIGYARVSTQDQNLELQTEALTKAGCKKVFEDKISGGRAERPGLAKAQESLREGDTLVVWKLDRLGRSVKHLVDLVGELGVTTPNVKNRTLRNFDHSFEAAKGRRGLKTPLRRRPAACQV